ncbi:MAG TPA: PLP-dependent transferase, partial [Rubrivivax sp.]|nr:PLP-dependent transferase [Rubrivivax sp.]
MPKPPLSTTLIHHPYRPPDGFVAPQPGVFKASTVIFPNVAALHARDWKQRSGYTYGLHGTPTTFLLEERIATLEGGLQTLLLPSGLAAITLVDAALLAAGDEVLIPDNAYGPCRELARQELQRWGIGHRLYDPSDPGALAAMIGPATRLLWLEAPGSITMEFPDLPALVRAARERGVTTVLDNTWGAGVAFSAFELEDGVAGGVEGGLGVDISAHALTKFPSGGGDVLMGAVTTRDEALHLRLKATHMRMGFGVGANDVEAVLHALPSLALRYAAQDAAGRTLARWWAEQPQAGAVLHPALPGSPGHDHWARLCTQAAGLFSVLFDERHPPAQVHAFCDALRLFKIGYSWAGPVSLAVPYDLGVIRPGSGRRGTLVRFSMGLEDVRDLQADCEQALAAAF